MESDTDVQRCGGCGKRFDRKAALSAHSQYCHRRVAAYENTTKVKKIHKVPPDCTSNETISTGSEVKKNNVVVKDSSTSTEMNNSSETSIRVEAVASLSKADWDMLESREPAPRNESNGHVRTVLTNEVQENVEKDNSSPASDNSDPLEIVYTSINNKMKTAFGSKKRKNKDTIKKLTNGAGNNSILLPISIICYPAISSFYVLSYDLKTANSIVYADT